MTADPRHNLFPAGREGEFVFSGRPRKIEPVAAIHYRWPTKSGIANEYIRDWQSRAAAELAHLRLSRDTLDHMASHSSRADGTCRMTDRQLSSRSGRSLRSTQRDIERLNKLGWVTIEYVGGDRKQERVRVLRISHPMKERSRQRIPQAEMEEVSPTYPHYVGGPDKGGRLDV